MTGALYAVVGLFIDCMPFGLKILFLKICNLQCVYLEKLKSKFINKSCCLVYWLAAI